jgi:hypothetical protein
MFGYGIYIYMHIYVYIYIYIYTYKYTKTIISSSLSPSSRAIERSLHIFSSWKADLLRSTACCLLVSPDDTNFAMRSACEEVISFLISESHFRLVNKPTVKSSLFTKQPKWKLLE